MRVLVITSNARRASWEDALGGLSDLELVFPEEGAFRKAFFEAASRRGGDSDKGRGGAQAPYSVIVVDAPGLASFPEITTALYDFARMRTSKYAVRVILVAPDDLNPGPVTQNLVTCGYYDLVLPSLAPAGKEESEAFTLVPKLLRERATFKYAYDKELINVPFMDSLASSDKVWEGEASVPSDRRGLARTIAVAGVTGRCGCTTFVLALASSIAIAGKDVSIVMNERDHRLISAAFAGTPNEQGVVRFRPTKSRKGVVDVYPILNMAPTIHTQDRNPFVIYDFGTAPVDVMLERRGSDKKEAFYSRWVTAEAPVLVTGCGAEDLFALGKAGSAMRKRGVGADIFANLCPPEMVKGFEDGFREVKGLSFFRMEAVYNPLYLTEAPDWLKSWADDRKILKLKGKA